MLKEKALQIAEATGEGEDFKASNGWVDKFRKRHQIQFRVLSGEGASVNQITVEEWKKSLPVILEGYSASEIYNVDETGLFYEAFPKKSLVLKGETCQGGKNSKTRFTVCFTVNLAGEKEPPIIIGQAKRPRDFQRINVEESFNVVWRHNKTAWMKEDIYVEFLENFNQKMIEQNKHVLLFMDNCSVHKNTELSNVKIVFFPANTTSQLQPLDQGIIQNFKCKYRKFQLRSIVGLLDEAVYTPATQIKFQINKLDAVNWIRNAWDEVKPETITKCFQKCGFLLPEVPALDEQVENDTFEIEELVQGFNVNEFIYCDQDLGNFC